MGRNIITNRVLKIKLRHQFFFAFHDLFYQFLLSTWTPLLKTELSSGRHRHFPVIFSYEEFKSTKTMTLYRNTINFESWMIFNWTLPWESWWFPLSYLTKVLMIVPFSSGSNTFPTANIETMTISDCWLRAFYTPIGPTSFSTCMSYWCSEIWWSNILWVTLD